MRERCRKERGAIEGGAMEKESDCVCVCARAHVHLEVRTRGLMRVCAPEAAARQTSQISEAISRSFYTSFPAGGRFRGPLAPTQAVGCPGRPAGAGRGGNSAGRPAGSGILRYRLGTQNRPVSASSYAASGAGVARLG